MVGARKPDNLRVFISYSRQDADAADALVDALAIRGFEVTIDRRDLPFGEKWQAELAEFIRLSDTVIWLVSEASIASKWVNWELDEVSRRSKRLVPVLIGETPRDALPRQLGEIHILPAHGLFSLDRDVEELSRVLETDRAWLKEASRLQDRAAEWLTKGRARTLLLPSASLKTAEQWRVRKPKKAQLPAPEVLELLLASRQAATIRQRWWVGGSFAVALGAISLAVLAYFQSIEAVKQAAIADQERKVAVDQKRLTEDLRRQTQTTESGLLSQAAKAVVSEDPSQAMLLSLEALPDTSMGNDRPFVADARLTLEQAIGASREVNRFIHDASVSGILFSPDSRLVAVVTLGKSVDVLERSSGNRLFRLTHGDQVKSAAFSPDGRLIATGANDKAARLWELSTGKQIAKLDHQEWGVLSVAFSPNGQLLATGSGRIGSNGTKAQARIWNVATLKELQRLSHDDVIQAVEFNFDGRLLITRARESYSPGYVLIWEAATGRELARLNHGPYAILDISLSSDGRLLATASSDKTARLWDTASGAEIAQFRHDRPVSAVKFSPDCRLVATQTGGGAGSAKGDAQIWEVATRKQLALLTADSDISGLAFSPDSLRLATGSLGNMARLWDIATGKELFQLSHNGPVRTVTFSPDGQLLATGSTANTNQVLAISPNTAASEFVDGEVRLWDMTKGKELIQLGANISNVAISPDGQLLAPSTWGPGAFNGDARLLETSTGKELIRIPHGDQVSGATFSPDGRILATVTVHSVQLWQVPSGKKLAQLRSFNMGWAPAFSPDSKMIVTPSTGGAVISDIASGKEIARLAHEGGVRSAVFSRSGQMLATTAGGGGPGGYKGEARLWTVPNGKLIAALQHDDIVCCAAFSPDGALVVTASNDQKVRVWNAATGKLEVKFEHDQKVVTAIFSPDGRSVATASGNVIGIWEVSTRRKLGNLVHDRTVSITGFGEPGKTSKPEGGLFGDVRGVAFSSDGLLLVTVAGEVARLWAVGTGKELARFESKGDGLMLEAKFSPDGNGLITASANGTIRRKSVFTTTQSLVDYAKSRVPRCLSAAERKQYYLPETPPQWCMQRKLWPYHH